MYAAGDINSTARGSGARANKGKISLSLIPLHLLAGTARVFMYGKLKYAEWNWAKGMQWSIVMDCLLRHIFKWWYMGEEFDEESEEHHLDHAICNLLMLRHYITSYKEGDDRPPPDLTGFDLEFGDFCKPFIIDEFLARHPEIQAYVDKAKKV